MEDPKIEDANKSITIDDNKENIPPPPTPVPEPTSIDVTHPVPDKPKKKRGRPKKTTTAPISTKKVKITRVVDGEDKDAVKVTSSFGEFKANAWTQVVRTSAMLALGAGSWYFNNIYGRPPTQTPQAHPSVPAPRPSPLPVTTPKLKKATLVGTSGFYTS